MATTLLLLRPETLAGAILLRAAQITLSDFQPPDLGRKPVLLLSGADDPTILPERFSQLVASLRRYGASLETKEVPVGHELSAADIRCGRQWTSQLLCLLNTGPSQVQECGNQGGSACHRMIAYWLLHCRAELSNERLLFGRGLNRKLRRRRENDAHKPTRTFSCASAGGCTRRARHG